MDDLTAFVSARLDEDEVALADDDSDEPGELRFADLDNRSERYYGHFAGNERVRREIAAKRAIVAAYEHEGMQPVHRPDPEVLPLIEARLDALEDAVLAIAAIWSGHQDYKQEWAT